MELIDAIISKIKDDSGKLTTADFSSALTEAMNRYSNARPLSSVVDQHGSGVNDQPLPPAWIEGFSDIMSVEYPVDQVPASILDPRDYSLYARPAGKSLRLNITPLLTETIRVTFTIMHTEASVPIVDMEAIANLAASLCLRQLAASFGQTGDSTILADSVNYRSKADEFRRLADSFEGLYKSHLGIQNNDTVGAASCMAAAPDSRRTRLISGNRR